MLYILFCTLLCYILLESDRGFPVYVLFTRLLFDLQDIFYTFFGQNKTFKKLIVKMKVRCANKFEMK